MKDLMRTQYELLRIPKTGSETMKQSFAYAPTITKHLGVEGHGVQLSDVPDHRRAIVALRDPIERFRSGYDMNARDNEAGINERYPTANDMARDIHNIMYDREWGYTYIPQVYWTHGADYMKYRNAIWVMTPDIDGFLDAFSAIVPEIVKIEKHANRQSMWGSKSVISDTAQAILRHAYAADYRMLERLRESNG